MNDPTEHEFETHPELLPLLQVLREAGVTGDAVRTWLTTPSSFLSGEIPQDVARTDPARAVKAAERFAAGPPEGSEMQQILERIKTLNLAAEFEAAGDPYSEADPAGTVNVHVPSRTCQACRGAGRLCASMHRHHTCDLPAGHIGAHRNDGDGRYPVTWPAT